jgi:hypothetical protein
VGHFAHALGPTDKKLVNFLLHPLMASLSARLQTAGAGKSVKRS